jgi:gliding motility-associated transport system permease protein
MSPVWAVFKRELRSYFVTPVAYVFIVVFLLLSGWFTFFPGAFYETGQATLNAFFSFHPWLYLFLVPPLSMRLWAEERRSGSIELLMTLPLEVWHAVVGKFFAAWAFTGLALALTFPIWITVNYLGDPDNGAILTAYIGSLLMAGGFLAVGACISALTKNQIVAFIVTIIICLLLVLVGTPWVLVFFSGWVPSVIVDGIASLSFYTHFNSISRGLIDLRDVVFFALLIGAMLYANTIVLQLTKAE